jgi:hypothetical protein
MAPDDYTSVTNGGGNDKEEVGTYDLDSYTAPPAIDPLAIDPPAIDYTAIDYTATYHPGGNDKKQDGYFFETVADKKAALQGQIDCLTDFKAIARDGALGEALEAQQQQAREDFEAQQQQARADFEIKLAKGAIKLCALPDFQAKLACLREGGDAKTCGLNFEGM